MNIHCFLKCCYIGILLRGTFLTNFRVVAELLCSNNFYVAIIPMLQILEEDVYFPCYKHSYVAKKKELQDIRVWDQPARLLQSFHVAKVSVLQSFRLQNA